MAAARVQGAKVFLNGKWVGIHRTPDELKTALLTLRRSLTITEDVSVVYDHALMEVRCPVCWGQSAVQPCGFFRGQAPRSGVPRPL